MWGVLALASSKVQRGRHAGLTANHGRAPSAGGGDAASVRARLPALPPMSGQSSHLPTHLERERRYQADDEAETHRHEGCRSRRAQAGDFTTGFSRHSRESRRMAMKAARGQAGDTHCGPAIAVLPPPATHYQPIPAALRTGMCQERWSERLQCLHLHHAAGVMGS